jgi:hypothetical protein
MYIVELFTRTKLSPVAVAHHIGSITIAATAIAISLNWKRHPDATLEFTLCYLWGKSGSATKSLIVLWSLTSKRNLRRNC